MKNLKKVIFSLILTIILVPVLNAEQFKVGDVTYNFEERSLTCDSIAIDQLSNPTIYKEGYVYFDSNDLYYVTENGCSKMTTSETLTFYNTFIPTYYYVDGTDIIEYSAISSGFYNPAYYLTSDTTLDPTKTYYDGTGSEIQSPDVNDIATYYEEGIFLAVPSTTLDATKTYYTVSYNNAIIATKVDGSTAKADVDTTPENALNYFVLVDEADTYTEETILTVTAEVANKLEDDYEISFVLSNGYIIAYEYNTYDYVILNSEGTVLYTLTNLEMDSITQTAYENYGYKLSTIYGGGDNARLLTLQEYKLLSEDNRKISGKVDYEAKTSGPLANLEKVMVDDKEITNTNYTLKEGSTIITLKKDYLSTLSAGKHTLTLEYIDGITITSTFEIDPNIKDVPKTFDGIGTSIIIGIVSLLSITFASIYLKKEN